MRLTDCMPIHLAGRVEDELEPQREIPRTVEVPEGEVELEIGYRESPGLIHGLFLMTVVLPDFHPRMASEYEGPTLRRRLEPPGFLGLNYGHRTPFMAIAAQAIYGIVLGACFTIAG